MRNRSNWREFALALHQIEDAIQPHIPLAEVIANWHQISMDLRERARRRVQQIENIFLS